MKRAHPRAVLCVLLAALALALPGLPARADEGLELRVKAAFLFNFTRFANWPTASFKTEQSPIVMCVLESDPIAPVLEQTVEDKEVDGRAVQVLRRGWRDELDRCHLLFVGGSERAPVETVFATTRNAPILTVHEVDRPLSGGVARLYLEAGRLRFEINDADAQRRHLQFSAKLLGLAQLVKV